MRFGRRRTRTYGVFALLSIPFVILRLAVSLLGLLFGAKRNSEYVRVRGSQKFLHREIAERRLRRPLLREEVVHHINGNPKDNRAVNLCVLSYSAHRAFHDWLKTERARSGRYPSKDNQRSILVNHYAGILLTEI